MYYILFLWRCRLLSVWDCRLCRARHHYFCARVCCLSWDFIFAAISVRGRSAILNQYSTTLYLRNLILVAEAKNNHSIPRKLFFLTMAKVTSESSSLITIHFHAMRDFLSFYFSYIDNKYYRAFHSELWWMDYSTSLVFLSKT